MNAPRPHRSSTPSGEATGAIALVVPAARWPLNPEAVDALRDTARAVSRELGAPVWPPRR